MNMRFLDIASQEVDDAIDFYNAEREGLGDDFWVEVKHALNSIIIFPKAWHPLSLRTSSTLSHYKNSIKALNGKA